MLDNELVHYTAEEVPTRDKPRDYRDVCESLTSGYLTENMVSLSRESASFRDAVLGTLVQDYSTMQQENSLDTLLAGIRSSQHGSIQLKVYTEYAAAIAFALDKKNVVLAVLKRNSPQEVTPFVWSVVSAMHKQMPSPIYVNMLSTQLLLTIPQWEQEKPALAHLLQQ